MAERTLTVRLRAIADGYTRVLDDAARRTEDFASRAGKVTAWGSKAEDTGKKLMTGLTLPIAGAGVAVLAMAGNFERSMREVQALTGSGAGEMAMLSEQAKKMGADTQFSASQAADAMGQLVKGGFDARQTYQALPGVMQLAAAAGLDIASAADIATNVLSGFRLQVSDLATVNDYLAQTANASDTDVRELGEAFKYVGPVAKGAGMSLEETTATLGLFAENGIRGEMAGTALRGALTALLSPSDQVAKLLGDLGINATGANGQILPMVDILDQLAKSGATTGQIMEIFGQRAGPAMIALLGQGSGALRKFTSMLEESGGVAQNLADSKMGGLLGSWEQLKGAIETLAITLGEAGITPMFTGIAKAAAGATDAITGLPTGVQRVGFAVAGLAAASGPAIWGLGKLTNLYRPVAEGLGSVIGKLQGVRVQLALAQMDGLTSGQALLSMFGPQAAILVGLAALAGAFWFARKRAEEFAASHTAAGDAAEALAESAGIALTDLEHMTDAQGKATEGTKGFRDANIEAIRTLDELHDTASKQAYLVEIGYQLVLRGATPEAAFEQVEKLARYAGVELPVSLTVGNIGDFQNQVDSALVNARRASEMVAGALEQTFVIAPKHGVTDGIAAELDKVREAATAQWDTGNFTGFVELLGRSEAALDGNADKINYLADESMKALGDSFGFSIRNGHDLADMLEQIASGTTAASKEEEQFARSILDAASAMDGGLTPANIAAAAAHENAAQKAKGNADATKAAGDAAAGATDGVDGMTDGLDAQATAAEDAEKAFKSYLDTLRGAIDPMLAMVDAFTSNREANQDLLKAYADLDAAIAEHGAGSKEAADAQDQVTEAHMRAAKSAEDVMIAAQEMQRSIDNGTMSVDGAKTMLLQWVDQGLISAETARLLADQFTAAATGAQAQADKTNAAYQAAANFNGTTATATITANTDPFYAAVNGVVATVADIANAVRLDVMLASPMATSAPSMHATPKRRAAGGALYPMTPTLVGEHGPELVTLGGHQPAWVSTAEQTREMLTPARSTATYTPAGPAPLSGADLTNLSAKFAAAALSSRPIMGDYHVHTAAKPSTPAELARAAKFAKALVA